jgi:hypothetical protein
VGVIARSKASMHNGSLGGSRMMDPFHDRRISIVNSTRTLHHGNLPCRERRCLSEALKSGELRAEIWAPEGL